MLNYGYAILETEASLVCHAAGLDPALGLMHTDTRYRGSLASDLMEPVRPIVDKVVLELLTDRELERGDVVETREGVCRLGAKLACELAASAAHVHRNLAPEVGHLRSKLLARAHVAFPDRRIQRSRSQTVRRPSGGSGHTGRPC